MFTHDSYDSAMRQIAENRRANVETLVTWDAGDGWRGEGYWCSRRRRLVIGARSLSNPNVVLF
jgi:hypothetical protein